MLAFLLSWTVKRAAAAAATNKAKPLAKAGGLISVLRRLLLTSPRLVLDSLKILLPTAIFFIKFLEWWYSPSSPARVLSTSPLGPAVPPPRLLPPHPKGLASGTTRYCYCGLCQSRRETREVPCYIYTGTYMGSTEGACMIVKERKIITNRGGITGFVALISHARSSIERGVRVRVFLLERSKMMSLISDPDLTFFVPCNIERPPTRPPSSHSPLPS